MLPRNRPVSTKEELLQLCSLKNPRIAVLSVLMSLNWGLSGSFFVIPAYVSSPAKVDFDNFTTVTDEYNLNVNEGIDQLDLFASLFSLGNLLMAPIFGRISDRIGRRPIIILSIFGIGLTGLLCAASHTYSYLLLFRLVQGTLYTPSTLTTWVLVAESTHPSSHAIWGLVFGISWIIGSALVAPIVILSTSWRMVMTILSIPNILLALFLIIYLPESLEYALLHGHKQQLSTFLHKMIPGTTVEVDALLIETSIEESKKHSMMTKKSWNQEDTLFLVATGSFISFSYTLIHNAMSLTSTAIRIGDVHWNFILSSVVELPSYAAVPLLFHIIGDKGTLCVFHILTASFCFVISFMSEKAVIYPILWLIVKFASSSAFMCALVVLSARYPVQHRTICVAITAVFGNTAAVIAPEMYILDTFFEGATFIAYGSTALIALILTIFIPRMKK